MKTINIVLQIYLKALGKHFFPKKNTSIHTRSILSICFLLTFMVISVTQSFGQCANQGTGANQDFDCDGVINSADFDDDNDGIIDAKEQCTHVTKDFKWHGAASSSITSSGTTITVAGANWATAYTDQYWSIPLDIRGTITSATFGMIGILPVSSPEVTNTWNDGGYKFQFDGVNGMIIRHGTQYQSWTTPSIVGTRFRLVVDENGKMAYIHNGNLAFIGTVPTNVDYKVSLSRGTFSIDDFILESCSAPDLDGDGIVNRFDLDSDNDDCIDAIEGSLNLTISDVNTNNQMLAGGVDGNGIPLVATVAGQKTGSSQDYTTQDTDCVNNCNASLSGGIDTDNDGITNFCDLDDENDGILDLVECEGLTSTVTYSYTGGDQFYTVPNDVDSIEFRIWGAAGGGGGQASGPEGPYYGGGGGYTRAIFLKSDLPNNLLIVVGQGGYSSYRPGLGLPLTPPFYSIYGGGGVSIKTVNGVFYNNGDARYSALGGGLSGIFDANSFSTATQSDAYAIAGGGGGSSQSGQGMDQGGAGGGLIGMDGGPRNSVELVVTKSAEGGTQTSGGGPGFGFYYNGLGNPTTAGYPGGPLKGGDGFFYTNPGTSIDNLCHGGGGGGGGYFGGGGGGSRVCDESSGGGSGYLKSTALSRSKLFAGYFENVGRTPTGYVSGVGMGNPSLDGGNGHVFIIEYRSCDYDNDGIANNLDTDSDEDGCADAFEGGNTIGPSNVDNNDRLNGNVNSNGIPLIVGSGQALGDSQNASIQDSDCNPCTSVAPTLSGN